MPCVSVSDTEGCDKIAVCDALGMRMGLELSLKTVCTRPHSPKKRPNQALSVKTPVHVYRGCAGFLILVQ